MPNQKTDTWAYLLGGYLACCYSLNKQPSQLTAFDVQAFVESQDIGDVRKALLANCGQDLPPAAIDAVSEYLLTVVGRNQVTLRDTAAIDQAPVQLPAVDRMLARRRAEDYWRTLILRGRDHGERGGALSAGEFQRIIVELRTELNQLNQETVSQMSRENAEAFLAAVDEEDQAVGDLYEKDHDAGYRRLD